MARSMHRNFNTNDYAKLNVDNPQTHYIDVKDKSDVIILQQLLVQEDVIGGNMTIRKK